MAENGSYDNVIGPGTPADHQDYYVGHGRTVRLPVDMTPRARRIWLGIEAALAGLSRVPS